MPFPVVFLAFLSPSTVSLHAPSASRLLAHRSDGVPIVGCDGDIAIANGYSGATVAQAWWDSTDHRASLYQPAYKGSTADVCITFAMTHGGYNVPSPNEPSGLRTLSM